MSSHVGIGHVMPQVQQSGLLPFYLRELPFDQIEAAWAAAIPDPNDHAQIRRVIWVDRFYLMARVLGWPHVRHPWVYQRCREVERDPHGCLHLWFRGAGKSSIVTIAGVIQDILRDPESTTGIFSHTAAHAKDSFLSLIMRELETNQMLHRLFPDILFENPKDEAPRWSLEGGIIVKRRSNKKECTVEAHGIVDGQPTGKHFENLCYDDIVTEKSVGTSEQIQKTNEAFSLSDNLTARNARKRYCGTRYHYNDPYAEMIARGSVKVRIYPATDDGTLQGKPVLLTREQWAEKKRGQLASTIACQLLLNPQAGGERMFDITQVARYETRPRMLTVYVMCDPAHSKREGSDETAFIAVGVSATWNLYVLEVVCHRMLLPERWRRLRDLYLKYSEMSGVVSCKIGYEKFGAQSDRQHFEIMQEQEGVRFEIHDLEWPRSGGGSKIDRVQRLVPYFQSMKLHLPYRDVKGRGLTGRQLRAKAMGDLELISGFSRPNFYKQIDEEGHPYDALAKLENQIDAFPFTAKKDAVDALSRLFDMDIRIPVEYDSMDLEPDEV
jgi:hypothetical protein